jgi:hypothetical protein
MADTNTSEALDAVIDVDTSVYLAIQKPDRIKEQLSLKLTDHCYRPRIEDLESDWVAHVAAPGFKVYRQQRGGAAIDSFCSLGTGSGLDVLSAVEILGSVRVGLTDVHEEVVATAVDNIVRNQNPRYPLTIESGYGDLLAPLLPRGNRYTVIYENLPNVRLQSAEEVSAERNSSTYAPPRTENLPELVKQQMLDLHYLALVQARDLLLPGGAVLSCLGARVPLHVLLSLGELAGYRASFLTYCWKVQEASETLIPGYAASEKNGFGPFYFYRTEVLQRTFSQVDLAESGENALEIEHLLLPHRLDATGAYAAFNNGEPIGHTVAFLKSELR